MTHHDTSSGSQTCSRCTGRTVELLEKWFTNLRGLVLAQHESNSWIGFQSADLHHTPWFMCWACLSPIHFFVQHGAVQQLLYYPSRGSRGTLSLRGFVPIDFMVRYSPCLKQSTCLGRLTSDRMLISNVNLIQGQCLYVNVYTCDTSINSSMKMSLFGMFCIMFSVALVRKYTKPCSIPMLEECREM